MERSGVLKMSTRIRQSNTSPKCLSTLKERIFAVQFQILAKQYGNALAILFYISDQLGQPLGICQPQREDA